ncbi:MAG: hypothetical protein NZT61_02440 [Deltaproteobacteria bacterium]|nr:hypothetical protein [Deltaproteobacteria bacterium]MCX7952662.1 hypothetical protein [Deltaproteobacteria bacterium]
MGCFVSCGRYLALTFKDKVRILINRQRINENRAEFEEIVFLHPEDLYRLYEKMFRQLGYLVKFELEKTFLPGY